jgi:hypothetical protein
VQNVVPLLRSMNIVGAGLVAGAQVFVMLALIPAMKGWPSTTSARLHRDAMITAPETYLRPSAATSMVTAVLLMLLQRNHKTLPGIFNLAGLAAQLVNTFISARWEWPINNEILTWSSDSEIPPENYEEMRETWDQMHFWRLLGSVAAFVCFALAGVAERRK